jgi:cytidylate kinase
MAIITISRGTFAGGEKLAAVLAQRLSYRAISRELLYQHVQAEHGFKTEELADLFEDAPSVRVSGERKARVTLGERRRQLFVAVQASLCELVKDDDVVYHGNAGHLLLPGIAHVLRLRLIAPRNQRIEMAMSREGLTRAEACREIDRVDGERARWSQSFFGVNWGDPMLFDLVINLENLSIEEVSEVVEGTVQLPRFRTTDASRQRMHDLALASRVAARLMSNPATANVALDVIADNGVVRLLGVTHQGDVDWVSKVVQKIEGVKKIELTDRVAGAG